MSIEDSLDRIVIILDELLKEYKREHYIRDIYGQPEDVQEPEPEVPRDQPRRTSDPEVHEETAGTELSERAREIIDLAREMRVEYLVHDGRVVVDASVIDEYTRRRLGDSL